MVETKLNFSPRHGPPITLQGDSAGSEVTRLTSGGISSAPSASALSSAGSMGGLRRLSDAPDIGGLVGPIVSNSPRMHLKRHHGSGRSLSSSRSQKLEPLGVDAMASPRIPFAGAHGNPFSPQTGIDSPSSSATPRASHPSNSSTPSTTSSRRDAGLPLAHATNL